MMLARFACMMRAYSELVGALATRSSIPIRSFRTAASLTFLDSKCEQLRHESAQFSMRRMKPLLVPDHAWALLFARVILGLIFGMAGWGKLFRMGATTHAHRYFVDPYTSSWIPAWLLWSLGLSIPYVEFAAGRV